MDPQPVALVTGSGKPRIGWHVAKLLAERGYALAIHYRTSQAVALEAVADLNRRSMPAEAFKADLADEQQVDELIGNVVTRFGRIDVLVNCAAIWERKPLEAVIANDVRRHFEINTLGTF